MYSKRAGVRFSHRHSNSGPRFFLIWSLPRSWYGSLSGSIYLNHLSIFYNISCYNSLVLLTFVSRSSCRITYIQTKEKYFVSRSSCRITYIQTKEKYIMDIYPDSEPDCSFSFKLRALVEKQQISML